MEICHEETHPAIRCARHSSRCGRLWSHGLTDDFPITSRAAATPGTLTRAPGNHRRHGTLAGPELHPGPQCGICRSEPGTEATHHARPSGACFCRDTRPGLYTGFGACDCGVLGDR